MAELAAAGIAATGALGSYYLGKYADRKRAAKAQAIVPISKYDFNAARIRALSRQINRHRPATESTIVTVTNTPTGAGLQEFSYALTTTLAQQPDFLAKVLGDKARLTTLGIRYSLSATNLQTIRMILYRPKYTGGRITNLAFSEFPDDSVHQVLWDRTIWPAYSQNYIRPNIGEAWIKLNRLLHMDRTSQGIAGVMDGEIVLYVKTMSVAATTNDIVFKFRYQNK